VSRTCILLVVASTVPCTSRQIDGDFSVTAGGGVARGEDQKTAGALGVGVSAGFPYGTRHRFQLDYQFTNIGGELIAPEIGLNVPDADTRNHLFTGSYVVQTRSGRTRPFFQAGAGIVHRRFHTAATFLEGAAVRYTHVVETDTSLSFLVGAGITIDLGQSWFVRPQVRGYMYVGPTWLLLPSIAFGYRF
jgi:hypothetical protein